jgi:hypothetical protein
MRSQAVSLRPRKEKSLSALSATNKKADAGRGPVCIHGRGTAEAADRRNKNVSQIEKRPGDVSPVVLLPLMTLSEN